MIIDMHVGVTTPIEKWVDDITQRMENLGVAKSVIWAIPRNADEAVQNNNTVSEIVHKFPDKFIGFASVYTPSVEKALAELDRCVTKMGLVGLKLHPRVQACRMDDPTMVKVIERARELDLPVVVHVASPAYRPFPAHLGSFAQEIADEESIYSKASFLAKLISHYDSNKFYSPHFGGIYFSHIAKSNISFQTAGVCTEAIEYAYKLVGPERIVFGSDYPFNEPASELKKLERANIPEEAKKKILGENVKNVLKL